MQIPTKNHCASGVKRLRANYTGYEMWYIQLILCRVVVRSSDSALTNQKTPTLFLVTSLQQLDIYRLNIQNEIDIQLIG